MNSPRMVRRQSQAGRLCLSLFSTAAILGATGTPASALLFTSQNAISDAVELNDVNDVVNVADVGTSSASPADAKVQLGNGTNAFAKATFSEAFSTFRGNIATYWVSVNADNIVSPGDLGRGEANVVVNYNAVKQHGDRNFTLNVTGGAMRLVDPDGGRLPLEATTTLEALVFSGGSVIRDVVATAQLKGNGGTFASETFNLDASGFDFDPGTGFVLEDDGGDNVVGVHTELPAMKIPIDLSGITDGTTLSIAISLFAEANAPGGETEASVFLRDPAHADDPDPLAGGSTISITTDATGPVGAVPEPSGLALFVPALIALRYFRRGGTRRSQLGAGRLLLLSR